MSLKESGHYPINNLPKYLSGFHEADLKNFTQLLLKKSTTISENNLNDSFISLNYILQEKRFWSKKGKASIVAAYLDNKILSTGRTSESIKDIWFHKADVENFLSKSRMKTNEKTISQVEVAKLIGCMLDAVPVLISNGYLIGLAGPNRLRVKYESANKFLKQYVSFSALSIKLNTSSERLLAFYQKSGIKVLSLETNKGNITSFIKKEKVSLLSYQISRNPTRKLKQKKYVEANISSFMKVKYYLKHLKKKDIPFPRIGLKINKSKIAKACGLTRNLFYYDSKAEEMLESFNQEEIERRGIRGKDDLGNLFRYLENLKKSNSPLPIAHKGKPNKLVIAHACGIDRNIFYKNPKATAILKHYVNEINRIENQKT